MYPGDADGRRQRGRVAGQRKCLYRAPPSDRATGIRCPGSVARSWASWRPRPVCTCGTSLLGRTRIEGSLTEKSGSELMDEERINTDAELAQYVENILEKGKLPRYVGERPLVFPVCIGTNDYGRSLYQLECKCQIRGSFYVGYPEKVSDVFPKCARCIKEIKSRHKKAVYEEGRQARKQARKEKRRREATRFLPIWAQWLWPIFVAVLTVVLGFIFQLMIGRVDGHHGQMSKWTRGD